MRPLPQPDYFPIKAAIVLWGIMSALQGAALIMGVDSHAPDSEWASAFVVLAYYSVLAIGLVGFVSSRGAGLLLALSSVLATGILVFSRPSANGLGLGLSYHPAIGVIILRPALSSFLFLAIARSEDRMRAKDRA